MAAISERTWSSIRHQAQTVRLKRATYTYNRVPRCQWPTKDEDKARKDYKAGVPISEISAALQRSYTIYADDKPLEDKKAGLKRRFYE